MRVMLHCPFSGYSCCSTWVCRGSWPHNVQAMCPFGLCRVTHRVFHKSKKNKTKQKKQLWSELHIGKASVLSSTLLNVHFVRKLIIGVAFMAEWSKASDSRSDIERFVGSNPTECKYLSFFFFPKHKSQKLNEQISHLFPAFFFLID